MIPQRFFRKKNKLKINENRHITFTEEELEKIKSKKYKTIHIIHFAKLTDVDQIHFEKNYYVVPYYYRERGYGNTTKIFYQFSPLVSGIRL